MIDFDKLSNIALS